MREKNGEKIIFLQFASSIPEKIFRRQRFEDDSIVRYPDNDWQLSFFFYFSRENGKTNANALTIVFTVENFLIDIVFLFLVIFNEKSRDLIFFYSFWTAPMGFEYLVFAVIFLTPEKVTISFLFFFLSLSSRFLLLFSFER